MAVNYQCPQCRNQISTQYEVEKITCPFCGNEFEAASAAVPPQFQAQQQQQQYGQGQPGGYAQGPQPAFTPPPSNDIFAAGSSGKSRGVAGLLAIFLGTLGVHYIYLDKTTSGIIILLISLFGGVLTCGVLPRIIAVVVLIQGILMMTMSQDEFEKKYCDPANSFPLF